MPAKQPKLTTKPKSATRDTRNPKEYQDPNYAAQLRSKDEDNCYGQGRNDVEHRRPVSKGKTN